jgi:uncharacterized iron-regulated membrane protein
MSDHQPVVETNNEGFDPGEVDTGSVSLFGGIIVAIIIAVFIGVTLYWDKFLGGRYKEIVEASPTIQLQDLRQREAALLSGYSYVDKTKGQVRLPIDRAMQLLVSEVQAGKTPYNTKDAVKVAEPAPAAPPAGAAPVGAPPAAPVAAAAPAHNH